MKKKILITASTFPGYKGDKSPDFIYTYAKNLSKYFDITVLCPFKKGSKTYEHKEGIRIYRYKYLPGLLGTLSSGSGITAELRKNPINYLQIPFFLFFQLVNLIKLVKSRDIQVIHAHWIIPQGFIAAIYKLFFNKNIKVICTAHGGDIYGLRGFFANFVKKLTIRHCDKITCVSKELKNEILNLYNKNNIDIIPMGIDTKQFHPDKNEGGRNIDLIFVGRLVEKKGLRYLIEALREVIKKFPKIKLAIIGDGPEKQSLMKLTQTLDIGENIIFKGWISQEKLPLYLSSAKIFGGPSITGSDGDSEGFGLVFAEALSCETPVITTNLPAISDIVQTDFNGLLAKPKDPGELTEKILYLLENPTIARKMGISGRGFVIKNFDWEVIAQKYSAIIEEL